MREGWREVRLGNALSQYVEPISVEPEKSYTNLGVQWYAGGTFRREPKRGADMKATRLFKVRPGQFIYNRMFVTEGSFALVAEDHADGVVSNEFPVFDVNQAIMLPEYLLLHFQQAAVWARVADEATGTTKSRRRWKEAQFVEYRIALPPLAEQRRIVDLIGSVDDAIEAAEGEAIATTQSLARLRHQTFTTSAERSAAGNHFDIAIGKQRSAARVEGDNVIPYLRSANVELGRIQVEDILQMHFSEREVDRLALVAGDVLITEGSASERAVGVPAVWRAEIEGVVGIQNALIRVRAVPGVTVPSFAEHWAFWAYESGTFREIANGTNIKHVGVERVKSLPVVVLDEEEQRGVTAPMDALRDAADAARTHADALRALRSNLLTVLLSGEHEILSSYDQFLNLDEEAAA